MGSAASNDETVSADVVRVHQGNDNNLVTEVCNAILKEEALRLTELNNKLDSKCRLLQMSNEQLNADNKILTQRYSNKCAQYQNVNEDKKYQLKCNESLRVQMATSEHNNSKLVGEKALLNSSYISLRREKDTLENKCVSYERSNENNKSQIAILKAEKNKLSAECSQLSSELAIVTQRHSKLTGEKGSLNSDNINLKRVKEELSEKCDHLENLNENLEADLDDYESVSAAVDIRNLHISLENIREDIENIEGDNSLGEETGKLAGQISEKKAENRRLENELKRKSSYVVTNHHRTQQLIRAETELESLREKVRAFLNRKRQYMCVVDQNIKKYVEEIDKISTSANNMKSHVDNYRDELAKFQDESEVFIKRQREECEKILNLLDKQNNAMKILMALADADQDHSELREDNECYAVKITNLKESSDHNDRQRVISIIKHILDEIPEEDIDLQRVGFFNNNQIRPLMVYLSSMKYVKQVLKYKGKFKGTIYEGLLIVPTNKNERRAIRCSPQRKSATFFYESA